MSTSASSSRTAASCRCTTASPSASAARSINMAKPLPCACAGPSIFSPARPSTPNSTTGATSNQRMPPAGAPYAEQATGRPVEETDRRRTRRAPAAQRDRRSYHLRARAVARVRALSRRRSNRDRQQSLLCRARHNKGNAASRLMPRGSLKSCFLQCERTNPMIEDAALIEWFLLSGTRCRGYERPQ